MKWKIYSEDKFIFLFPADPICGKVWMVEFFLLFVFFWKPIEFKKWFVYLFHIIFFFIFLVVSIFHLTSTNKIYSTFELVFSLLFVIIPQHRNVYYELSMGDVILNIGITGIFFTTRLLNKICYFSLMLFIVHCINSQIFVMLK